MLIRQIKESDERLIRERKEKKAVQERKIKQQQKVAKESNRILAAAKRLSRGKAASQLNVDPQAAALNETRK